MHPTQGTHILPGLLAAWAKEDDRLWTATPFDPWRARFDLVRAAIEALDAGGPPRVQASYGDLARRWGWTPKAVRGFLGRLCQEGFLVVEADQGRTGRIYAVTVAVTSSEGHSQPTESKRLSQGPGTVAPDSGPLVVNSGREGGGGEGPHRAQSTGGRERTSARAGHSRKDSRHAKGHSRGHSQPSGGDQLTARSGTVAGTVATLNDRRRSQVTPEGHSQTTASKELSQGSGTVAQISPSSSSTGRRLPIEGELSKRRRGSAEGAQVPIPEVLNTPEFRAAWGERMKEREEKGVRLTQANLSATLRSLVQVAKIRGIEHAVFCLERATGAGHRGIVFAEDLQPLPGRPTRNNGAGPVQGRLFQPKPDAETVVPRRRFSDDDDHQGGT